MNAQQRQYIFGAIFLAFGIYQVYQNRMLEFTLYSLAGLSFIFNQLASEPKLVNHKKTIVITTWILIVATGLTFFYLLQFNYF